MVTGSNRKFAFLGRHVALDFANTVDWRTSEHPQERLESYSDLVRWSFESEGITGEQAAYLVEAQAARLNEAEMALSIARALREAIYKLVVAAITHTTTQAGIDVLNRVLREGLVRLKVRASQNAYGLRWADDDLLTSPLWPVAWEAAQLLTSPDLFRVKQCASEDGCGWLFLDRSKNLSRRWCDMRACGNTAKARRYRERHLRKE